MAMNIYTDATGPLIEFAIHLDTTQVVSDGQGGTQPDPDWVEWYRFPQDRPAGVTKNAWVQQCKAEAKALAKLARRQRSKAERKATDLGVSEVDNS